MKHISVVLFMVIMCPFSLYGMNWADNWANSYQMGVQLGIQQRQIEIEQRRLEMEEQMARQQMELRRNQADSEMRKQIDNIYQKGFMDGYKKGMDDMIADVNKNEPVNQLKTIDQLGESIFKDSSIENLLTSKGNINKAKEQYPSLSVFRVYNVLIDERLKELGYVSEAQKKDEANQNKKSKASRRK